MVNKTIVQGRLTADPELRYTQSGIPVATFTVAWSEKYKEQESKLFLRCVAWRGNAEFVSRYFTKGQETVVEGSLNTRKWQDNNGNNRENIELLVDRLNFCGAKKDADNHQNGGYAQSGGYAPGGGYGGGSTAGGPAQQSYAPPPSNYAPPTGGFDPYEEDDEKLPF